MIAELNERSREIFRLIVEAYCTTGGPIGSRTLSHQLSQKLSPATIRTVMADLEDAGLLFSPHTSAGRVPTETGYRYYVDVLLPRGPLPATGTDLIATIGQDLVRVEVDQTLRRLADAISEVIDQVLPTGA